MARLPRKGPATEICPDCESPCRPVTCDAGIGPNEFWGVVSNDYQPYIGSDCCGAELVDYVGLQPEEELDEY
jgi:hypothetical protein